MQHKKLIIITTIKVKSDADLLMSVHITHRIINWIYNHKEDRKRDEVKEK